MQLSKIEHNFYLIKVEIFIIKQRKERD